MRLPKPLLRQNKKAYKNQFGHALILAGSQKMLGASALCGLAAMRSGAGLVTLAVPKSLNAALQKKISPVLMTLPLPETREQTFSLKAWTPFKPLLNKFHTLAIGPGLSQNKDTQKLIYKIIENSPIPLVIDADALNAVAKNLKSLTKTRTPKILTPHPGEMARLLKKTSKEIESNRKKFAQQFALKYKCVLVLKGCKTVVASPEGKVYTNHTGNPGMATGGSGDVLTGMIAAFLAQGLSSFDAAKWGVFIHGKAGDLAAKEKGRVPMIATDIIDQIPQAF